MTKYNFAFIWLLVLQQLSEYLGAEVTNADETRNLTNAQTDIFCKNDIFCKSLLFGSTCVGGYCECPPDYIPMNSPRMLYRARCLKADKGTPLFVDCNSNEDCEKQNPLSECKRHEDGSSWCTCRREYFEVVAPRDIRCGKYIGENCADDNQCGLAIPGANCQKHGGARKVVRICFCKSGLKYDKEHSRCTNGAISMPKMNLLIVVGLWFLSLTAFY